jgi:imidazolonepropionase-like amidohydrolase
MKRFSSPSRFVKFVLMAVFLVPLPLQPQVQAVKAKKIYTVTQGVIENGLILIQDGRILEIGPEAKIPWNAEVLDFSQKVVIPGLIEAHAARGYDLANETNPLTPFVTVLDNVDTSHDDFKSALRSGVTAMNIMPGPATILGGKGAVVKTFGLVVEDVLLVPDSGMKISLAGTPMQSKMGIMAQLRRYFNETKDYMEKIEKEGQEAKKEEMVSTPMSFRSPESVKYEAVADLLKGRFPAFFYCPLPSDIVQAQKFSEAYGLKSVYILGPEGYKAADFVAEKKLKVILDPELIYFEKDPVTDNFRQVDVAKAFYDRGIEFALVSDPARVQSRSLLYQAMKAISCGIPADAALRSITIVPAQILGMDGLAGSLEKGKLANFVVLDKEPFDFPGKVEFVFIEGKPVYDREKDAELKALLDEKINY